MDASTKLMLSEAEKRNWDVVLQLIDNGVDVNARDPKIKFTPLCYAAVHDDFKAVSELLDRGANIENIDCEYSTPLMQSAYYSNINAMRVLLEHGANVNFTTPVKARAIHYAFFSRNQEEFDLLMKYGAEPLSTYCELFMYMQEYIGEDNFQWFHNCFTQDYEPLKNSFLSGLIAQPAAAVSNPKYLHELIEHDWPLDCQDSEGNTLLHIAAQAGQLDNIKILIEQGFSLTCKNKHGETPVHLAVKGGFWYIFQYATQQGIDIIALDQENDSNQCTTLLHCAAEGGSDDIVRYLITKGLDVNAYNSDGKTPLMLAAAHRHIPVVKTLLERGADVNAKAKRQKKSGNGLNKIDIGGGYTATVLITGLDELEKSVDKTGSTPLYFCVDKRDDSKSKANAAKAPRIRLSTMGAEITSELQYAELARKATQEMVHAVIPDNSDERSGLETARILIEAGARINVRNCREETPLFPAVRYSLPTLVKLLLKSGALYQIENYKHETPNKLAQAKKNKQILKLFKELPQPNKILPLTETEQYDPVECDDTEDQKTPNLNSIPDIFTMPKSEEELEERKREIAKWACGVFGLDPALADNYEECCKAVDKKYQQELEEQKKKEEEEGKE